MPQGGTGASCLFLVFVIGCAYALPLQLLPEVPGYIPVYIRHGDQPLEEINPGLAEAFHERSSHSKNVRQTHSDRMSSESDMSLSPEDESISDKNDGSIYVVPPVKPLSMNRLHADGHDMIPERLYRKTIEVPKNSVVKIAEISEEEERELASLITEIEREETKPNDLFDTLESNPLYSRENHDIIGRQTQRTVGSRPVSKWSQESDEAERNTKERGPIAYDRVPDEPKQESDEEARFDSNEKSDRNNFEREDKSLNGPSETGQDSGSNEKSYEKSYEKSDEVSEE